MTHAEAILRAAAMLDASGRKELSRKAIRDQLGLTQEEWMRGYTAIFQGMREDQPGGAPSVPRQFRGVFRRTERGRFVLTDVGRRRIHAMSSAQEAPSGARGARERRQVRTEGLRQVVLYPGEDGYWIAECPSLPGCISQSRTKAGAVANIREAINAHVAALVDDNLPVPEERFEAVLIAV